MIFFLPLRSGVCCMCLPPCFAWFMVLLLLKVGSIGVSGFSVISGMISVASFLNICQPCTEWSVICVRTQTAHTAQGICMVTDQLFSTLTAPDPGQRHIIPLFKIPFRTKPANDYTKWEGPDNSFISAFVSVK